MAGQVPAIFLESRTRCASAFQIASAIPLHTALSDRLDNAAGLNTTAAVTKTTARRKITGPSFSKVESVFARQVP
jgi:hypothetical protein